MGIHGIFKEIGPGQRISLAKLSSEHFVAHKRPLRLAIDISIWLFQIQAGKGGSNPALRTFYYRLLRLLTLNIHPLFVFDGPNKPLFKRNKKVGGPGVRVASVPEFLAKQLLKQFGFPWHVAPGEAEAECALLQREAIVDAVLSEDVDTLMFGSGVTLKNWSSESTSKTPTHVNLYRAEETKAKSGMDREGMILVALMSGGDYITEGIPGCGPKLACDAARAGYGRELCAIRRKDAVGFAAWREKLQHQIRTNEQKIFSRKSTKLKIPDDFPNLEVLGYYTQPCVSTAEKLARLRASLKWDAEIDLAALRTFTADAFDWRCLGGAKKFIRNLAPGLLVREMRLLGCSGFPLATEEQKEREKHLVCAIHGKRNHNTTDGELEYRISFIPMNLVPIDLSIEEVDDEFIPAGGEEPLSESEHETAVQPSSTPGEDAPFSPTKKRTARPYEPEQPEKLWMMQSFLQDGCPSLVGEHEASLSDPKEFFKQRRKARTVASTSRSKQPSKGRKFVGEVQTGDILLYGTITKPSQTSNTVLPGLKEVRHPQRDVIHNERRGRYNVETITSNNTKGLQLNVPGLKPLSSQTPDAIQRMIDAASDDEIDTPRATQRITTLPPGTRPFAPFAARKKDHPNRETTPRGCKRLPAEAVSPALSQKTIDCYWTPSPRKKFYHPAEIVDLISPSPSKPKPSRAITSTPPDVRYHLVRDEGCAYAEHSDVSVLKLPESVTKRRKKAPLRRTKTAPLTNMDQFEDGFVPSRLEARIPDSTCVGAVEAMDLASSFTSHKTPCLTSGSGNAPRPVFVTYENESDPSASTAENVRLIRSVPSSTGPTEPKLAAQADITRSSSSCSTSIALSGFDCLKKQKKRRVQLRESLQGAWKETEVEELDLSGDGSGWRQSRGRTQLSGWRKSGIEVLDLTGA